MQNNEYSYIHQDHPDHHLQLYKYCYQLGTQYNTPFLLTIAIAHDGGIGQDYWIK